MTKAPTYRKIQKATWQHNNATKNFDYTTLADRLRTVSWRYSSHSTGVVKPVYERSSFQLSNSRLIKKTHIWKFVNNSTYRDWGPTANQKGEVIKMWYTNIYSNIIVYQKYIETSIKVGCATRSLYSVQSVGSKNQTSSTTFVFFWPIWKTRWPPWPLIG